VRFQLQLKNSSESAGIKWINKITD